MTRLEHPAVRDEDADWRFLVSDSISKRRTTHVAATAIRSALVVNVAAYSSMKHDVQSSDQVGAVPICKSCYDDIKTIKRRYGRNRTWPGKTTLLIHRGGDRNTETTIYGEGDSQKIRCRQCALEGLACDKYRPRQE